MDNRPAIPAFCAAALAVSLGCAACDALSPASEYRPPDRWVASETEAELAARDRRVRSAEGWAGGCIGWGPPQPGTTAREQEDQRNAQDDAAAYGGLEAARCSLAAAREGLDSELRSDDPSDLFLEGARRQLHQALELTYLLGLEAADERDAICDEVGDRAHGGELVVRHDLADAAALGLLSQAELDAAKARDAARPPCSTRLESRFVRSHEWAPAETDADLGMRDQMVREARSWGGSCVDWGAPPAGSSANGWEQLVAQESAAYLGDLDALSCLLQAERLRSRSGDDEWGMSEAVRLGRLLAFHQALYFAHLRGLDVDEELDAACDRFDAPIHALAGELGARRLLADAAALGLLSQAELDTAQARDAARPPCSARADKEP